MQPLKVLRDVIYVKKIPCVKPRTPCLLQLGNCSKSDLPTSGLSYTNPQTLWSTRTQNVFPVRRIFHLWFTWMYSCKSIILTISYTPSSKLPQQTRRWKQTVQPAYLTTSGGARRVWERNSQGVLPPAHLSKQPNKAGITRGEQQWAGRAASRAEAPQQSDTRGQDRK